MYNAKKDSISNEKQLKYNCIGDRCYFDMTSRNNMVNIKKSYIPIENIIHQFK